MARYSIGAGDRKVDVQEFTDIMNTVITRPDNFEKFIMDVVYAVMSAFDRDGNGNISMEEYVSMYDAMGIPPATSAEAFKKLDRDGSGELEPKELTEAIREYHLSEDPDAPGNWIFGPLEF